MFNCLRETGNQDTEKQTCKMEQPHSNLWVMAPPWSVPIDQSLFEELIIYIKKKHGSEWKCVEENNPHKMKEALVAEEWHSIYQENEMPVSKNKDKSWMPS